MTTAPVPAEERTRQRAHLAAGTQGLSPTTQLPPSVIDREWSRHFYLRANVAVLARTHARTRLTMLRWAGNVEAATTVAAVLAQNTVDHANPGSFDDRSSVCLRLAVTEAGDHLIDASDPLPAFPDFGAAVSGSRGRGLWQATRLGALLSWFLIDGSDRKTVPRPHGPQPGACMSGVFAPTRMFDPGTVTVRRVLSSRPGHRPAGVVKGAEA